MSKGAHRDGPQDTVKTNDGYRLAVQHSGLTNLANLELCEALMRRSLQKSKGGTKPAALVHRLLGHSDVSSVKR
jgi:hypothetical protein